MSHYINIRCTLKICSAVSCGQEIIKLFILLSLACTVNIQINDWVDERPLLSRTDAMMCNHEAFDISVVKNQYPCVMGYLEGKRNMTVKYSHQRFTRKYALHLVYVRVPLVQFLLL